MLILSRHKDERIVIDHNIVLTVVAIDGDKVRIGIEAPPEIMIHRQEVEDAINDCGEQRVVGGPLAYRIVSLLDHCGGVAPISHLINVLTKPAAAIAKAVEKCPQLQELPDGRIALAGYKDEE